MKRCPSSESSAPGFLPWMRGIGGPAVSGFLLLTALVFGVEAAKTAPPVQDSTAAGDSALSPRAEALSDTAATDSPGVSLPDSASPESGPGLAPGFISAPVKEPPFGVGERLRYSMEFSVMRAGRSEMSIVGVDSSFGRPAFHFRSRVKSTRTVDLIYKVRDVIEAWFDVSGLYSWRYDRYVREGGYRSRKFFDYNHRTGWASVSNENGPKGVVRFTPFSHNIISALYWVRCQPLEAGVDLRVPLHDQSVQYPLTVKVYGIEEVKVPAGTFRCWKVEPVIESEGLFKMAGRLLVWLTDDDLRIPVMMASKIPVGSIVGRLVEYRPGAPYHPGDPLPEEVIDDSWDW